MLPTLKNNQNVLCFNWAYFFTKPKRVDIVAAEVNNKTVVKKIVKLESDLIFLEGDNKKESTDSRNFGPIKKSQLIGKIVFF